MRDLDFVRHAREHNARWLERLRTEIAALGIDVVPSAANFYLLRFDSGRGRTAAAAAAWLESRNIIPRSVMTGDTANVLRITVGLDHENEAVIAALREFMGR